MNFFVAQKSDSKFVISDIPRLAGDICSFISFISAGRFGLFDLLSVRLLQLFLNRWIRDGSPKIRLKVSRDYWCAVEGARLKNEVSQSLQWVFSVFRLWFYWSLGTRVICVGARDKRWVKDFFAGEAARVDFKGTPSLLTARRPDLRRALGRFLCEKGWEQEFVGSLVFSIPEDLFEGVVFTFSLFRGILASSERPEICSEDLIENVTSTVLVAHALQKGSAFSYKEHALPVLIFEDHFSWIYSRAASRVFLTENYGEFITDTVVRESAVFTPKNRATHFTFSERGARVICLPFIVSSSSWMGGYAWEKNLILNENELCGLANALKRLVLQENWEIKPHPKKSLGGRSVEEILDIKQALYQGGPVREVVFIGWTQGLYECLQYKVPVRLLMPNGFNGLTDGGEKYVKNLEKKGLVIYDINLI